jgi:hypothetical protein
MSKRPTAHSDSQFQSLLDTVEQLRERKFPQLDGGLVREILRLHASGETPDAEIARAVEQAVDGRLSKKD